MADYANQLRRSIEALPSKDAESRGRLYEQIRGALRRELRQRSATLGQDQEMFVSMELELCIDQIEREYKAEDPVTGPESAATPPSELSGALEMADADLPHPLPAPVASERPAEPVARSSWGPGTLESDVVAVLDRTEAELSADPAIRATLLRRSMRHQRVSVPKLDVALTYWQAEQKAYAARADRSVAYGPTATALAAEGAELTAFEHVIERALGQVGAGSAATAVFPEISVLAPGHGLRPAPLPPVTPAVLPGRSPGQPAVPERPGWRNWFLTIQLALFVIIAGAALYFWQHGDLAALLRGHGTTTAAAAGVAPAN